MGQRGGVLGLCAGRLTDDRGGQTARLQQLQKRKMGRAERGIRKGQVAFFAALGVSNAGKMRVEVYGAVITQPLGQCVEQGGVIRGGSGLGKLCAAAAGVQMPKVDAGGDAAVYGAQCQYLVQCAQLVDLAHRLRAEDAVTVACCIAGLYGALHRVQRLFQCGLPALLAAGAGMEDDAPPAQRLDKSAAPQQIVDAVQPLVLLQTRHARDTGWYLRNDIIWMKDNPMPESVKDRLSRCYEHVFLFSKSKKYFFDYKAISEPIAPATAERLKRGMKGGNKYGKPVPGQPQPQSINRPREHGEIKDADINPLRNKRDVWKINTVPFKGGHYAAYPPKLVETCLLAGCPEGGIVLDPFMGSGTTGMVASQMGRHFIGIELNPAYTELAYKRIGGEI